MNPLADAPKRSVRTVAAARHSFAWSLAGPLLVAFAMLIVSIAMRMPTAGYVGPPDQGPFNQYIFQHLGAYSDITSLYFRDRLWNHPLPYLDYPLEYPVGMGMLIWLLGFANTSAVAYLAATATVMTICALVVVLLMQRWNGAQPWVFVLSPALALYGVLNWDLFSIMLTVASLLCFRRNRDGWGALLLAAAVWTKFFPVVLVPLVLLDRVLRRRWRDAWRIGAVFGAASVLINAPVAVERTDGGWRLRDAWLHFFRFNQQRGREVNLWNFFDSWGLTLEQINRANAVLLALGVALVMLLMVWRYRRAPTRRHDLLLAASFVVLAWFFFTNKVYSPQYSLWLVVLLALLAAPPALVIAFAAADVGYFTATFVLLGLLDNPANAWFFRQVLLPATAVREAVILALIVWAVWRMVSNEQLSMNNEQKH